MAIAFDAFTNGNYTSGTTHTFSHTCSGSDRVLFVHAFKNANTDTITGATYNGVSMTLVAKQVGFGARYSYLFMLHNPATGANDVVITASASTAIGGNAASYTGAEQVSTADASTTENSSTTPHAKAVTTTVDNCWMVKVTLGGRVHSASTNSTKRGANTTYTDASYFDNNSAITPAKSYSMTTTYASSTSTESYIIASFAPAGAAPATTFIPRVSFIM